VDIVPLVVVDEVKDEMAIEKPRQSIDRGSLGAGQGGGTYPRDFCEPTGVVLRYRKILSTRGVDCVADHIGRGRKVR